MLWSVPGTTLQLDLAEAEYARHRFTAMFLGGGIVLSQVCAVTGLEPYTVQNWVKRGFLPPPQQKKYNLNQLCRIINISMLKRVLSMEQIVGLLKYVNGSLSDTSDDLIDDSQLYFMFLQVTATGRSYTTQQEIEDRIDEVMGQYRSEIPGAHDRVEKVLRVMLTAWVAAVLHEQAQHLAAQLQ